MASAPIEQLLTPQEVCTILGVKEQTLSIWRSNRRYPLRFVKCGRLVRYRREDVERFIETRTQS